MREHFQLILDGLQVGLEEQAELDLPTILPNLQPPTAVRAIVTIGGTSYAVTIEPADKVTPVATTQEEPECEKSTHGKHTPVDGRCIGCGEKVS